MDTWDSVTFMGIRDTSLMGIAYIDTGSRIIPVFTDIPPTDTTSIPSQNTIIEVIINVTGTIIQTALIIISPIDPIVVITTGITTEGARA